MTAQQLHLSHSWVVLKKKHSHLNIKTGHYLELLTPETMKLLGSTESKITKDKNG